MIQVLRETKDYIVVNKEAGLITETNPYEDSLESKLKKYLIESGIKKPFIGVVHRLDRVTSGCVLFAKKKSSLKYFNSLLEKKGIQKTYLAVTSNPSDKLASFLENYILKDLKNKKANIVSKSVPQAKYARLALKEKSRVNNLSLLEIKPSTGRFHQIRVQLSAINLPIYGDEKYMSTEKLDNNKICLHAYSLKFVDFESDEIVDVRANVPDFSPWTLF